MTGDEVPQWRRKEHEMLKRALLVLLAGLALVLAPSAIAGATTQHAATNVTASTHAQKSGPDSISPTTVCLLNDDSLCWVSPGGGNQVYVGSSNYATVYVVNCESGYNYTWCEFENANGHCFYDNGNALYEGSGTNGCTAGSANELIGIDPTASGCRYIPLDWFGTSGGMINALWGTYNDESGKPVWAIPTGTSGWVQWNNCP
jgi:hypothetical protein